MEPLSMYLAPWQKRMLRDFMRPANLAGKSISDITKVVIKTPRINCPASYKIPNAGMRRGDWLLYLTDEQMVNVGAYLKTRTKISSLNVSPEALASGDIVFQ